MTNPRFLYNKIEQNPSLHEQFITACKEVFKVERETVVYGWFGRYDVPEWYRAKVTEMLQVLVRKQNKVLA